MLRSLKLATLLAVAALVVLAFPLVALGQLPDPAQTDAFLDAFVKAVAAGDWRYVAVLAVLGLTALVRRFGPSIPVVGPYLVSSRAGALTALVLALVTGLAPPILGWVPWSVRIVLDVLLAGFASIGGWVGVRRILGVVPASAEVVKLEPVQ
jgi:hypothetical protein